MTQHVLIWMVLGELGLLAFMVFMYGIAHAKCLSAQSDNYYITTENARLKDELKQTILELTAEIEARKETSELLMQAGHELNQLNRQVNKRCKDGRYIKQ